MLRPILLTLSLSSIALYHNPASAAPDKGCGGKIKVLVKDVQLTSEQQDIFGDIKQTKKNWKNENGQKRPKAKHQWMIEYLNGDVRKEELHNKLDDHSELRFQLHQEIQPLVFDLLDTYSQDQKQQVLRNIDEKNECKQQKKDAHEERVKNKKGKFRNVLLKDMNLTQDQERDWEKIAVQHKENKQSHKENKSDYRDDIVEEFTAGEINRKQAEQDYERISEERISDHHQQTELWVGFFDGLNEVQKDQMIRNITALENRKKEHQRRR
jgi:hypothetical protein